MDADRLTLESPVQFLKTVGPARAVSLRRLGVQTAGDLIWHLPRTHLDRTRIEPIAGLAIGKPATVMGEVLTCGEHRTRRGGNLQTVSIADRSGVLFCVWFNQRYVLKQFRSGRKVMLSGTVQLHGGRRQMAHPDFETLDGDDAREGLHTGRLVPVYALVSGIGQHWLRRLIHDALTRLAPDLPDPLTEGWRSRRGLMAQGQALWAMHFPADKVQLERARERLVYQELLEIQLLMALRRGCRVGHPGIVLVKPGDLTRRFVGSLPFSLTGAQRRVLAEILADLRGGRVMHRLLQGDVGSGKTLVALIAALFVIEQGYQAVLMAPTEVLAQQHGAVLRSFVADLGIVVEVLTGSTAAAERRGILSAAGRGEVQLLVGTHAVIQDEVRLPSLALAIVDEQHRFGVRQRGRSASDDDERPVHLLVMSATPIPRSLALTLYGDLDLSLLDEIPAGRRKVATRVEPLAREEEVYAACRTRIAAGQRGYIIYPVVEQTEKTDIRAAVEEADRLAAGPFEGLRVGLVHGRLKGRQKLEVMASYAKGDLDVLVATTVVEVGIDVPAASWMVIHGPERFGLAQLHQLRGRIGRGGQEAACWLLAGDQLDEESVQRLRFFAAHDDGFRLAEEDLRRRGPGDPWGVRQHGAPGFRLANPLLDGDLARIAAEDVRGLLTADPQLAGPDGLVLRRALQAGFGALVPLTAG